VWLTLLLFSVSLQLLLSEGAEIKAKNDTNRTPLWTAAQNGHLEAVKLLIEF
jgi:ankyrin repeat protein